MHFSDYYSIISPESFEDSVHIRKWVSFLLGKRLVKQRHTRSQITFG